MNKYKKDLSALLLIAFIFTSLLTQDCSLFNTKPTIYNSPEKTLLFEITNDADTMTYPPGKTLTLRVFNNEEIEFDLFPINQSTAPSQRGLRKSSITRQQLEIFESLLIGLDAQNPKSLYPPTQVPTPQNPPLIDGPSFVEVTVSFLSKTGMKQIVIQEKDSHIDLNLTRHYPAALIELLKLTYQINRDKQKEFAEKDSATQED